jgi:hypothetical protein
MSIIGSNILAGASGQAGYNINNSLRFRSSASAYLNRTFTTPTNNKIWTWSGWVKGGVFGDMRIFSAATGGSAQASITFNSNSTVELAEYTGSYAYRLTTTQVFRDPSAWYHIVGVYDSTQATAANRVKLYVNGNQVTALTNATYPTQNYNGYLNSAMSHTHGSYMTTGNYFDGYMTEVNFVDGQALTPSSFGETDTTTGSWKPKAYTSTYGTNGFKLNFSDIATTSGSNAGLGKDFSGNGNYFNTNNISVTAGVTYDAMTDVPTNTSATVANYAVLNLLKQGSAVTVSNGNLRAVGTGAAWGTVLSSIGMTSGKWYCEITVTANSNSQMFGICQETATLTTYVGASAVGYGYYAGGDKYNNGVSAGYGASYTANDVIGIAYDADIGSLTFYKNNSSQGVAYSGLSTTATWFFAVSAYNTTNTNDINFGQRPFSYTPPTGYVALNTYNLPTPTILQGNLYMDATLYTGNGVSQVIVNQGQFKPDFVWVKSRSVSGNPVLVDSVRGANKVLYSPQTTAEETPTVGTAILSFNSNGFSLGGDISGTSWGSTNGNTFTYVGWQWQAGQGSSSSNTSGSITSTVSVNATAGFSVVTYTGTGSTATVGHGLGVTPKMIIVKNRSDGTTNWAVYHTSLGANAVIFLNSTAASTSVSGKWGTPSSTTFGVNTADDINKLSSSLVAYCWAEIAGFSKFTSYTGNGSADGPFVYCGFRPKFVIIKCTNDISHWTIEDTAQNSYNVAVNSLYSDTSAAQNTTVMSLDFLSNGFKCRNVLANESNVNGYTYIVAAFAENPFKNSNAR